MLRLRLARKEVHTLHVEIPREFLFCRCAVIAVESLDDGAVHEAKLRGDLQELRLRQSAADSGGPEVDVAARRQRQFALHHDVGEVEPPAGF